MTDPISSSQLRAAILEVKGEILDALHEMESRILTRMEHTIEQSEHRMQTIEVAEVKCHAEVTERLKAIEAQRVCYHSPDKPAAGTAWADPKILIGIAAAIGTLVWYLVERLVPLLQAGGR